MKIKKILLTGDDGYNSIGTRILIHHLRDNYELQVSGTKTQQSGVGGKLNIIHGGKWGQTTIDGIPALWVDGTPCDAVECAYSLFKDQFDLVISGINLGANLAGAIASGTLNAARRAVKLPLAPYALAFSWDIPGEIWFKDHSGQEDIADYLNYPGKSAVKLINHCIKQNFYNCPLLNINLPKKTTNKLKITKFLFRLKELYQEPVILDKKTHQFSYPNGHSDKTDKKRHYNDVFALNDGYISLTPCHPDNLHLTAFNRHKGQIITLPA